MDVRDQSLGEFLIRRKVLDEVCLDELGRRRTHSTKTPLGKRVKDSLRCTVPRVKQTLLKWIPVLSWLPRYSIRENAVGDFISGISVGIMHLPQGMAYALLASLPPVFGLYTSLFPVLVYFIFGTSRHVSIGTFAVISIMIGGVTEKLAPDGDFEFLNGTNGTGDVDIEAQDASRVQIACAITILTGIFQILLGLVRFGFVVTYLSEPLVRGYTTAAACHVTISQLKYIFGVKSRRFSGPLSQVYIMVDLCSRLPKTNVAELAVSLVALCVLVVVKELNACYSKKLPMPIPIELVVIIAATVISYFAGLNARYGIDVVGEIPSGLQAPRVPDVNLFSEVVGDAFAIAIVGYAINISLSKTFALKHGYKVDSNQELVALGLSNSIGAFFQCYCVTSSLSRSLIQESTGGKTQVAGVVSSIIVLITVLKIGSLFENLPKAVLSTIVYVNLKGMYKQFLDVGVLWKKNKVDLLVWLVTFTSTILFNLDLGLAMSVAFSLLTLIFRTQLPRYSILGQVRNTELYLDVDTYEEAKEIPGITVFCSSATICYTNAELYLEALQEKSGLDIGKLLTEKKRGVDRQKRREKKEKKKAEEEAKKQGGLTGEAPHPDLSLKELENRQWPDGTEAGGRGSNNGEVNQAYEPDAETSCHGDENATRACCDAVGGTGNHSIILDLSATSFVDTVAVKTLKNIFRDFGEIDVAIYLARCQVCVVEQLERADFFSESVTKNRLFATVHDAVLGILKRQEAPDADTYDYILDVPYITKM